MVRIRMALVLVAVLGFATASGTRLEAQGPSEGIRVRGHWVMEVRNPDGTVVERREFDNALHPGRWFGSPGQDGGAENLVSLLKGAFRPTHFNWEIEMNQTYVCDCPDPWRTDPATDPWRELSGGGDLLLAVSGTRELILTGTITAPLAGAVQNVQTLLDGHYMTATVLPTPLALAAGQVLQITVTISFSSAPHPPSF